MSAASESNPRVLILGSGAMACVFAGLLSRAGAQVTLLDNWPEGLHALRQHGVRLQQEDGSLESHPLYVTDNPSSVLPAALALVLVKSYQTERAGRTLARCLAPDGLALSLQNGLGNDEILRAALGQGRVAAGIANLGAFMLAPGLVRPHLGGGGVDLCADPRLRPLGEMLQRAGIPVRFLEDIASLQWGKLVINSAVNPLSALMEQPNAFFLRQPQANALLRSLGLETAEVAAALNIPLPYADVVAHIEDVLGHTPRNETSMLQDLRRGAPTEIDAINGAVVRAAESIGRSAPLNQMMVNLVKARLAAQKERTGQ